MTTYSELFAAKKFPTLQHCDAQVRQEVRQFIEGLVCRYDVICLSAQEHTGDPEDADFYDEKVGVEYYLDGVLEQVEEVVNFLRKEGEF